MKKQISCILLFLFVLMSKSIHANDEVESDSLKKDYWLTFSGIYIPQNTTHLLLFGVAFEYTTNKPRITRIGSFYNTYWNAFKGNANSAERFTSLSYGFNYNLLKKHKLNIGLQAGLFLSDGYYYFDGNTHAFGITISPQLEYKYCFKKIEIGIDILLFSEIGKFKTPYTVVLNPLPYQITYDIKYDVNLVGYFNLKISKHIF